MKLISRSLSVLALLGVTTLANAQMFSNSTPIIIPGTGTSGPANPYANDIIVSGVGTATNVIVSLLDMSHTFPDDIDILLVAPNGANILLMSDAGGSTDLNNVNYTFADGSPSLSNNGFDGSGTYAPTNYGSGDIFPSPAPAGPYTNTSLANLLPGGVNGTWTLYVVDDLGGDTGTIAQGWQLNFTGASSAVPEPGSIALLVGAGIGGLVLRRRKR